jgi:uncharacterized protein YdhG (YjbR/CyaY superfamily)
MSTRPATIPAYLATVRPDRRAALQRLRWTIRAILPAAEECISYGLPAFRLDGEVVAGFAATASGCSYYPFSGSTLRTLAGELEGYSRTRSALHFEPGAPLPVALVRKLLRARRAELKGRPRRAAPRDRGGR